MTTPFDPLAPPPTVLETAARTVQESPAPATGEGGEAGQGSGSPFSSLAVPLVLMVVIFWVLVIGPERKLRKKREAMLKSLGKGDRVITTGGIHGKIVEAQEHLVTVQIADGVRVKFSRSAVQGLVDEGGEAKDGGAKDEPKAS